MANSTFLIQRCFPFHTPHSLKQPRDWEEMSEVLSLSHVTIAVENHPDVGRGESTWQASAFSVWQGHVGERGCGERVTFRTCQVKQHRKTCPAGNRVSQSWECSGEQPRKGVVTHFMTFSIPVSQGWECEMGSRRT